MAQIPEFSNTHMYLLVFERNSIVELIKYLKLWF